MTTTLSRGPSVARSEPDLVAIYADRARRLGLPFVAEVVLAPGSLPDPAAIEAARFARSAGSDGAAFIAPAESAMPDVARWLAAYPAARDRLSVATPSAIRTGLIEAGRSVFVARAVRKLASAHPDLSASRVATGPQVLVGAISALALAIAVYLDPGPALVAINLLAAFFFFGVSILRLIAAALATPPADDEEEAAPILGESDELPVYTILVPLLREAHLVGDLVAALDQIDWPRGLLDIKLIVEADDPATIDAARIFAARPPYEVIVVPVASPRTKPKALAFALPFACGEFVTVYDAEDQPHPQQLRQAHAVFARSDPELACLQSALVVDNRDSSLLARLFAIEYAALFDGLLPALTALDMPLPLGGTSNHFRGIR